MKINSIKAEYKFILLLIIIAITYGYAEIIDKKPYSLHLWRQCDCLSFTSNYFHEDINFLEPKIHWSGSTGDGKTVSEFPIHYYVVAQLWKIFGQNEMIFRILNILIVFTGLFYLFKTYSQHIKNIFWSIFIVLFLFTSQILVYYTNNFLSNAPSFGLVLIACYFLWKYYNLFKTKYLYFSSIFFLLAGLLKLTALLSLFGILPIHLYLYFFDKKNKVRSYSFIPVILLFFFLGVWYYYAIKYNDQNLNGVFLQGILPVWELNSKEIHNIYLLFKENILSSFFNKIALFTIFGTLIFSIFHYKYVNKFLLYYSIITLLGSVGYILLFYQVFTVHDYYLTNLLIVIPMILLTFFDLLKNRYPKVLSNKYIKVLFSFLLILLIIQTSQINRQKYFSVNEDFIVRNGFQKPNEKWETYHVNFKNRHKKLGTITPYLRELGIERNDKVISIPDYSPNITLYLTDQKGYTDFGFNALKEENRIQEFIRFGAKYIIINDSSIISQRPYLNKFIKNKIGQYKNIYIYKID